MARPNSPENVSRASTGIRLPTDLHARLQAAANDREVSVNWLITRAVEAYLVDLLPVEEMITTRSQLAALERHGVDSVGTPQQAGRADGHGVAWGARTRFLTSGSLSFPDPSPSTGVTNAGLVPAEYETDEAWAHRRGYVYWSPGEHQQIGAPTIRYPHGAIVIPERFADGDQELFERAGPADGHVPPLFVVQRDHETVMAAIARTLEAIDAEKVQRAAHLDAFYRAVHPEDITDLGGIP